MAATVLLLTSYVLLAVYVSNVDGSNRRRSFTQADGYCVNGIIDKCINQHMTGFGTQQLLFSPPLEDHCRFANNSLDCAFEELHSTEGRCRLISEESKGRYTNQIRVWTLFVSGICETGFDMFNESYDCIRRNFDSFENMTEACQIGKSRLGATFNSRCDRFANSRNCAEFTAEDICGESAAGLHEFARRFQQTLTTFELLPDCLELARNKDACELQIKRTCLAEYGTGANLYPSYSAFVASKTLKDHCGMIEKILSCAGDELKNRTSSCGKLDFPQQMEFNFLITSAKNEHKYVCETGFTEFNAAYDCLFYGLKNAEQLVELTESCMPNWNDEATRMKFCDNFETSRTCLQNSSATICGKNVSEAVKEFIDHMYNNYAVDFGGAKYYCPQLSMKSCPQLSMKRSVRHILNTMTRK